MGYCIICDVCGESVEANTGGEFKFFDNNEKILNSYDLCEDCKNVMQRAFEGLTVLRGNGKKSLPCDTVISNE